MNKPVIPIEDYFRDAAELITIVSQQSYDAIVCLKRSGFMLGAYLSNQLTLPLFTTETKILPQQFKRILVVDDKVCTGKSIRGIYYRLTKQERVVTVACLYTERDKQHEHLTYTVRQLTKPHRMFYEK